MRIFICSIWALVPRPGIEPGPSVLGVWSLSLWATREVQKSVLLTLWCVTERWNGHASVDVMTMHFPYRQNRNTTPVILWFKLVFVVYMVDLLAKRATCKSKVWLLWFMTQLLPQALCWYNLKSHCSFKGRVDLFYMHWKSSSPEEHNWRLSLSKEPHLKFIRIQISPEMELQ